MSLIYVAAPLRGITPDDTHANINAALACAKWVVAQGHDAICPHTLALVYNDEDATERKRGMNVGLRLLMLCDQAWFFTPMSDGMRSEWMWAELMGIKCVKWVGDKKGGWCRV
jgi:hypothetical protein